MGIFDDVFDDDWGKLGKEEEEEEYFDDGDEWTDESFDALWTSGSSDTIWNANEPWTSEKTPEELDKEDSFNIKDFFE